MKQYTMKQKYLLARVFLRIRQWRIRACTEWQSSKGLRSKTLCVYYTMKQKYLLARVFLRSRQWRIRACTERQSRKGLRSKTLCVYYTTNKRYCPHLLETKLHAVALCRQSKDIFFVCRRYHVSKASLMRWNKAYDETKESLMSKSHRPHSPHPNAHTEFEIK